MVISLLVLWSICFSSSFVHFKNVTEYLTRGTAQVFIPLIRFLPHSFVWSSFLILLRHSFLIFSFISTCLMVSASNLLKYSYVSFFRRVLILSWFGSSIPFVRCRCRYSLLAWRIFLMPNFHPYVQTVYSNCMY